MTPNYVTKKGKRGTLYLYRLTEKPSEVDLHYGTPPHILVHVVWGYDTQHAIERLWDRWLDESPPKEFEKIERVIDRS